MKRRRVFLWALAWIAAMIIASFIGRGLAWITVYSKPSHSPIIKIHPEGNQNGDREKQPKRLAI